MTVSIQYPFEREALSGLKLGEVVLLSGRVNTGRDRLHKFLFDEGKCPVDLKDGAIFHCGPVVLRKNQEWQTRALGPTTSMREEPYMSKIIQAHGVRVVIGKGGMGPATQKACKEFGCVYLQTVGGAAQVLNECVERVAGVHFKKEFGSAEALWELDVKDLPAIVAIDTNGRSIHRRISLASRRALVKLLKNGFKH
jgi:fumarate hydratase class I